MNTFLKVLAGIFVTIIIAIIGLNLYLTDDRLRDIIVPKLNEQMGREIQVEKVGFTLFRTFPHFGLSVLNLRIPDTDVREVQTEGRARRTEGTNQPALASLDELLLSVSFWSLISGNVNVNSLEVDQLYFKYVIYEDGTTNVDSLMESMAGDPQATATEEQAMQIDLNSVSIKQANIEYNDLSSGLSVQLSQLNAFLSLSYGDLLQTNVDSSVDSFRIISDGTTIIDGLPLRLVQQSTLDMDKEVLSIQNGTFNIRGLDLDISGLISEWSSEALLLDLTLKSSSDDLESLLAMIPENMKEDLAGVETRGNVLVESTIKGRAGEGVIPDFNALISVNDGYLKYPGVDSPVESIQIRMEANNSLITIDEFSAKADVNSVFLNGTINNPLEDNADFNLDADIDLDLATVRRFYPLENYDLSGTLKMTANALGVVANPEEAQFNADVNLTDGYFKMVDLDEPVRDISISMNATQDLLTIQSFGAKAAGNTVQVSGTVRNPIDEARSSFDLKGNMNADLSTISSFYPINADTLDMRGKLVFNGSAAGQTAEPDKATVNGTLKLTDGYLRYYEFPKPLENIQIDSRIAGERFIINSSGMRTGGNNFSASGDINKFMSENPVLDVLVKGTFILDELSEYVDLSAIVKSISGTAVTDTRVSGPAMNPENLQFNGSVLVSDVFIDADSLDKPIRDMNGELLFSNNDLNLRSLIMKMGESDYNLSGELRNYMRLVEENPSGLAELTATFKSNRLNVDEVYQWEPTPEDQKEPFPIELPNLISNLDVDIKELVFFGVTVSGVKGVVRSNDTFIAISDAVAQFFGGKANGDMRWDVPQPDRTKMTFNGVLENMRVEELFKQFNPAGLASVPDHLSGGFSTNIEYITELDVFLDPIIETTLTNGNFGMTGARLKDHPAQLKAAELLRTAGLSDLSLDNLLSKVDIVDNLMTLNDLNITSKDIGVVLNGSQHLLTNVINYQVSIVLPGNMANNLQPVLTTDGIEALKREDGKVVIPFKITGTTENPSAGFDTQKIESIVSEYLKNKGSDAVRDRIRDLFN